METQEGCLAAPRLSYLDVGMDYLEREEPQETDDIRKNLDDRFLECLSEPSNLSQKNSLDSKDHMCVYLRIRPFTAAEIEQNESQDCVSIQDSTSVLVKPPQNFLNGRLSEKGSGPVAQKFTFTQVFGPETTQFQFFDGTIKQNMIDFMEGQNRLIFTYGVTNAGKTFTFQGTKTDAGILPRSMNLLFDAIKGNVYLKMDLKPHRCRDYVRLTKEQVKVETALKNSILRQYKEVDPHCSMKSNNSKASVDISDTINEEVISGFEHSSSIISESEERERESEQYKLNVDSSVKFSVWVSFCEIYNECIFDLLDPISGDKFYKRKTLRLAQDVKGFSFVKDIQWIQVSDAKEACKILALGKKFQSIANTKLNSSSSRSHSIFNIRLLRIDDISRVVKVSELALCDLAGSERCTKTQNEGERLKESGNINTSLLILGKCINALKNSQQSKIPRHVPFRESKLTHYLQSFFSGKGKVCMIVNICQSASSCDETLNVLKFSAVAQKVLILDSCTSSESISCGPKKSARDVSFIINNADNKMWASRKRATVHWDSALEDVMEHGEEDESLDCTHEDEDDDDDVEKSEQIIVEKDEYLKMLQLVEDLKTKLMSERREKLLMELKIREEVAKEFSEHFMQRENDLCEYMQREKELVEDRCDERLEIFQDLVKKCSAKKNEEDEDTKIPPSETEFTSRTSCNEDHASIPPETLLTSVKSDLAVIKKQAVQAYFHIASIPDPPEAISELEKRLSLAEAELSNTQDELKKSTMELNCQIDKCSKTTSRLDEAEKKLLTQKDEIIDFTKIIQEKDSAIEKLKAHVAHWEAKFEEYDKTMNNIKGEMKKMSKNDTESIGRKRPLDEHSGPSDQPPSKKELVENITTNFPAAQKQINVPDLCESSMQEIENEKCETEKYKEQMKNFKQNIALLEEKLSRSVDQVMQMESKNETLVSELQMSKNLNLSLEEAVKALTNEVDRNKQNIAGKVAQIRTIQVKLDEFVNSGIKNTADLANFNFIDLIEESKNVNQSSAVTESQTRMENSGRESTFYSAIDGLWKECQRVLQESTKKNQLIKELKEQLDNLNNEISLLKNENIELQHNFITVTAKDELLAQLRNQLSEGTNALECKEKCILESKKEIIVLRNQIDGNKEKITELESLLDSQNDTQVKMGSLEMQNKEKATAVLTLENRLEEVEMKRTDCENKLNTLNDYKVNLEQEIVNLQNKCTTFENTCQEKEKQVEDATQEIKQLKKDLSQQAKEFQNLRLDLQRKEEDYTDLKDKLNDAKKQIHQVDKEVSSMREEKKLLTNKLCEYEKLKNQMSGELEMKQRTIQQLKKDPFDNEKNRETMRLYQIACEDVKTKEKIIEDMRTALLEQEQTQTEQDQALEAKIEEADKLTEELEEWKNKYRELETNSCKILSVIPECEKNILQTNSAEVSKLQSQLREYEEKHISERKKWLDEKMKLLAQTKESETHRNKEMRKFAEDRERFIKQQTEIEQLNAQLAEKDNTLLKWREERDQLLSELEIQLKSLLSSNMEKEKEIENLKNRRISQTHEENSVVIDLQKQLTSSDETIKELQQKLAQLEQCQNSSSGLIATDEVKEQTVDKTVDNPGETNLLHTQETKHSTSSLSSIDECQDGSQTVLDSSSISTESGKPSRFPKPELEIHFSPVKPNKFAVKHHGDDSPITVKISRPARKRKSHEMEQDIIRTENKKNALAKTFNKTPCSLSSLTLNSSELKKSQRQNLKKQTSSSSTMSGQKKDGTFQKLGDFFQSSPSIFHTKAKKILQTISSPKPTEVTVCGKENESKPKRNRRRLYTTDISVPLDIPIHPMVLDKNEKESDHLIMKRRLRTRTAK